MVRPGAVRRVWRPAVSVSGAPSQVVTASGPVPSRPGAPSTRTGTGVPSMVSRSARHAVATRTLVDARAGMSNSATATGRVTGPPPRLEP